MPRKAANDRLTFAKIILLILAIGGLFFSCAVQNNQDHVEPVPIVCNGILISWDGVQRNHLNECLERGELPHLAQVIDEGHKVDIDIWNHVTDTAAGHAQMLTGYDPQVTGVYGNSNYRPIPAGYSVFEDLQRELGNDRLVTIMLTAKAGHMGSLPGQPYHLIKSSLTVWDGDESRTATVVGNKALSHINTYATVQFFAFFHFKDADSAGHLYGENSIQYNQAIIECDFWLGEIMAELDKLGIYKKTWVFLTADHGFDEGSTSHSNAPYIYLVSNDPRVVESGEQRDIVPTLLVEMGCDYTRISPSLPGEPLIPDKKSSKNFSLHYFRWFEPSIIRRHFNR